MIEYGADWVRWADTRVKNGGLDNKYYIYEGTNENGRHTVLIREDGVCVYFNMARCFGKSNKTVGYLGALQEFECMLDEFPEVHRENIKTMIEEAKYYIGRY